jgi:uncharacterized protein (TIGR02001 family)
MLTSVRSLLAATLTAAAVLVAVPAQAQEGAPSDVTLSGNIALVTDYRFRGVSLSGGDPAVQGGLSVSHSSGFYVGAWSSSIDGGPVYGEQELDLYGGWTGEVSPGIIVDAGLLRYAYPSNDVGPADYWEPYASVATTFGPARAKVGVAYAWKQKSIVDALGNKSDNLSIYGNLDVGVPTTPVTVSAHLGYTDGVLAPGYLAGNGDKTGLDWSVGASATLLPHLTAGVSYVGVGGPSVDGFTDDTLVGSLTLAF